MGGTFTEAQKRSESILGLVVREESIQLAQMVRTSKGHKLQQLVYWSVNVPDKSTDPILEQPDFYARQIKQALDLAGVKGASVALVLPSQYLTLVNATIPQFSMPEMDDMDAEFFADFLPESFAEIDQYQLAWQVQKQIHDHGEMDVLLALSKKKCSKAF
jgi:Tfp pilus assembly PilM family ATPase